MAKISMKKIFKKTLFLVFALSWSLIAYSYQQNTNQAPVFQAQISPDQIIANRDYPNICRLTIEKTSNNIFTLKKAESDYGKTSHFFKIGSSDYALEIWQNNEMIFSGGFNEPNVIRHELMDESGKWERVEMPLDEATLLFRVPFQDNKKPMTIKIYRTEAQL